MNHSEKLAIAAHLHVLLRRKTGADIDAVLAVLPAAVERARQAALASAGLGR